MCSYHAQGTAKSEDDKKAEEPSNQGLDGEADVTSSGVRLGIAPVVQEMVEQGVRGYLERGQYELRRSEEEHRSYRNGYEAGRVGTAEGESGVQVPQVRDAPKVSMARPKARAIAAAGVTTCSIMPELTNGAMMRRWCGGIDRLCRIYAGTSITTVVPSPSSDCTVKVPSSS